MNTSVALRDIYQLLREKKRGLRRLFILSFAVLSIVGWMRPTYFVIYGAFYDGGQEVIDDSILTKLYKAVGGVGQKKKAEVWMHSKPILEAVIKKEALAITKNRWRGDAVAFDILPFLSDLEGDVKQRQTFALKPQGPDQVFVKVNGASTLWTTPGWIDLGFASVWVKKLPSHLEKQWIYFEVLPLSRVIDKLKKSLYFTRSKIDSRLISIRLFYPSQTQGELLVDALMKTYQDFLVEEENRTRGAQIDYAHRRQKEIFSTLIEKEGIEDKLNKFGDVSIQAALTKWQKKEIELSRRLKEVQQALARYQSREIVSPLMEKKLALVAKQEDFLESATDITCEVGENLIEQFSAFGDEISSEAIDQIKKNVENLEREISQLSYTIDQIAKEEMTIHLLSPYIQNPYLKELIEEWKSFSKVIERGEGPNLREKEKLDRLEKEITLELKAKHAALLQERVRVHRELKELSPKYLSRLNHEIRLADKENEYWIESKIKEIKAEEQALEQQLSSLSDKRREAAQFLASEKTADLRSKLAAKTAQGLTDLAESIAMHHNFFDIQSIVFEHAEAKDLPVTLPPLVFAFLGSSALVGIASFGMVGLGLARGFPLSRVILESLGYKTLCHRLDRKKDLDETFMIKLFSYTEAYNKIYCFEHPCRIYSESLRDYYRSKQTKAVEYEGFYEGKIGKKRDFFDLISKITTAPSGEVQVIGTDLSVLDPRAGMIVKGGGIALIFMDETLSQLPLWINNLEVIFIDMQD